MTGQELYLKWAFHPDAVTYVRWEALQDFERKYWDSLADHVNAEIAKAVLEEHGFSCARYEEKETSNGLTRSYCGYGSWNCPRRLELEARVKAVTEEATT